MPRLYHSPSSIALGARCERAWAEQYIAGHRDPQVPWVEIEALTPAERSTIPSRIRASSLGVAVHATLEAYATPGAPAPDWYSTPGLVAMSGLHHLPRPALVPLGHSFPEESIGDARMPAGAPAHAPATALRHAGLLWAGFRDWLVAPPRSELARLHVQAPNGWLLIDYKSTSDIARWALTPERLVLDVQANLYALDVCALLGVDRVAGRWLYLETRDVRRSHPVDAVLELSRAHDVMGPCAELARKLDTLTCVEDAAQNTLACSDYGKPGKMNCPHHVVNGGTCTPPRRTLQSLITLNKKPKKETQVMPMDPEMKAKFDALKAQNAGGAAATPAAAPARRGRPPAAAAAPAEVEAPAAPAPRPRAARPAPAAPAPTPQPAATGGGLTSVTIEGGNGPLMISGDKTDVLELVNAVLG